MPQCRVFIVIFRHVLDRLFKKLKLDWKHLEKYTESANFLGLCCSHTVATRALSMGIVQMGFPDGSDGKESACNAGDPGLIPGLGRSPGVGNRNPLQYSCLENLMDRGAWRAAVHGVPELDTIEQPTHCWSSG